MPNANITTKKTAIMIDYRKKMAYACKFLNSVRSPVLFTCIINIYIYLSGGVSNADHSK